MYVCICTGVDRCKSIVRVGLRICLEHGILVGVNSTLGGPSLEITGCFRCQPPSYTMHIEGCMFVYAAYIIYNAYRGVYVCVRSLHHIQCI